MTDQPYPTDDYEDQYPPQSDLGGEFGDFASPDAPVLDPTNRPGGMFWAFYLFFRPGLFFRHFVVDAYPLLTPFAAWMLGVSGIIDRLGTEMLKDDLRGRPYGLVALTGNWLTYWQFCLALGLLSGAAYFVVGGWFFRARLTWCGVVEPDKKLADRVYLFAWQVAVIPALVYAAWQTSHYPSPLAAAAGEDWGGLIVVGFLLWSVYTSYRGVRTAFEVRRWAARVWFFFLPGLVYFFTTAGIILAVVLNPAWFEAVPDTQNTVSIDRPGFFVKYPGNWTEAAEEEETEDELTLDSPGESVRVLLSFDAPDVLKAEDSLVRVELTPSFDLTLQLTLSALRDAGLTIEDQRADNTWGPYQGSGARFTTRDPGGNLLLWHRFTHRNAQGAFHVTEIVSPDCIERQQTGLDLIRGTFRLKAQSSNSDPEAPADGLDADEKPNP